ncbi:MAG: chemotaxis protein CheD [Deltaproteobacteria bacterium]|nr:chemotaxis protein CheD [Candidatus Anaeroferrophillus wilburensis]MBN2889767.1 chemotaxis protein CheD [Deltaproteobacteria bacterium]
MCSASREYYLKPGYIYCSREPVVVYTVLGSCVAVTLWDSRGRFSAINHYLLPSCPEGEAPTARYGEVAMFALYKMMREQGAKPHTMTAQIFGGGDLRGSRIGSDNIAVAREFLQAKKVYVSSEDVGGTLGRKVVYHAHTNETVVLKVEKLRRSDWYPYE